MKKPCFLERIRICGSGLRARQSFITLLVDVEPLYPDHLLPQETIQLAVEFGAVAGSGVGELEMVAARGFVHMQCEAIIARVGCQQAIHPT